MAQRFLNVILLTLLFLIYTILSCYSLSFFSTNRVFQLELMRTIHTLLELISSTSYTSKPTTTPLFREHLQNVPRASVMGSPIFCLCLVLLVAFIIKKTGFSLSLLTNLNLVAVGSLSLPMPVSYTHLDVYKRQAELIIR